MWSHDPDDDQMGARVVDHTKLRHEREHGLVKLTERNKVLELRLAADEAESATSEHAETAGTGGVKQSR
jgi:hypothetical protein